MCYVGEGIILHTPQSADYLYNNAYITTQGETGFMFTVKACTGAKIALSEVPNVVTFNTYELVIGPNNGKDIVLKDSVDGSTVKSEDTHTLLDCHVHKVTTSK